MATVKNIAAQQVIAELIADPAAQKAWDRVSQVLQDLDEAFTEIIRDTVGEPGTAEKLTKIARTLERVVDDLQQVDKIETPRFERFQPMLDELQRSRLAGGAP